MKLVIVDDDPVEIEMVRMALNAMSITPTVHAFEDPIAAIEFINSLQNTPALIVIDFNMPRISGLDCLRLIGKQISQKGISVIVQSCASPGEKILEQISALGGRFLLKPYSIDEYRLNLSRLIQGHMYPTRNQTTIL
jgi:CheY-like chemotaxis protein